MYTTFTAADVVFVNASFANANAAKPLATAAPPAETERPPRFKAVTLYVAAVTDELELKFTPTATSEHTAVGV